MEENVKTCAKCKETFSFAPEDVFWDEHGMGYATKLVRCKECGCINVIEHIEDYSADVNSDLRFYKYSKK